MNEDLKIIKRKYGEKMMHLCRTLFPSLLETKNLLPTLLLNTFEPNHHLYNAIATNHLEVDFKNFIYSLVDVEKENQIITTKTPKELMSEAGYNLFECHTEEDIQSFKKYYAPGEELCTFYGGRLNKCHVFFAVKKNVDEIKREDFLNPSRQDLYGTSVISIQFDKDPSNRLSIKNRYNHTVNNPDSTFSNNLDNIIPGLTNSFKNYYGLNQKYGYESFEIPGYVLARDGKYYKYNYEINNVYYCPNNIIIDNGKVKRLDSHKFILFDYFILELTKGNKKITDSRINPIFHDSFISSIGDISNAKIEVTKNGINKDITIIKEDGTRIILTLNSTNCLIGYMNDSLKQVEDNFLQGSIFLQKISLPETQEIGDDFLYNNMFLNELDLPKVKSIGRNFLKKNKALKSVYLPEVEKIGPDFLYSNTVLNRLDLPQVYSISTLLCINHQDIILNAPMLLFSHNSILNESLSQQIKELVEKNKNNKELIEKIKEKMLGEMLGSYQMKGKSL